MITQSSHHCLYKEDRNQCGNRLGGYKYLGAAIGIQDIMLGEKEEFGRGGFGEMCVHLQWAEMLCCFTLLDIPPYLID